jgi:glucosamine--fructose-6-phosphate aminotransferase (isomerizing)
MCGIVGAVSQRDIVSVLLEGLKRLEYRGYDSAGLAIVGKEQNLKRLRVLGKVKKLREVWLKNPLMGTTGIAHTRWATHGAPSEYNAHPHFSHDESIAVVHNGIIENHEPLRKQLREKGYQFNSDTDTEVIVHMLHWQLSQLHNMRAAVQATVEMLSGAYSLAILLRNQPHHLWAVRSGSSLVIGLGDGEQFVASDPLALLSETQKFIYLEEGDIAELSHYQVDIFDKTGHKVERPIKEVESGGEIAEKAPYRHFMQKEIFEQPDSLATLLEGRFSGNKLLLDSLGAKTRTVFPQVKRIQLVACGTSYHAALVAKYWFEGLAGMPTTVEIASEFRYRKFVVEPNTLFICISQSGETADTLAALRLAKSLRYLATLAVCNVQESTLVREADLSLMMRAGPEIGVASTKAFSAQLVAFLLLVIAIGRHQHLSVGMEENIVKSLKSLPQLVHRVLALDQDIKNVAAEIMHKEHALFLGRGALFPIALEGALKLKELSYIHAEAYPAGELKHGPLALVDDAMPVIAIVHGDELLDKMKSNLQEVRSRGAQLFIFTDAPEHFAEGSQGHIIALPKATHGLETLAQVIPLQLLAYHVAVLKGTDVDQPRNLAKSVTVE